MSWIDDLLERLLPRRPTVPTIPAIPSRFYSIVVDPKDARVTLVANGDRDLGTFVAAAVDAPSGLDDYQMFEIPADVPPWGARLTVSADGYQTYSEETDVLLKSGGAMQPVQLSPIPVAPAIPVPQRLSTRDRSR